ncbi:MAG: cytochrome C [Actinobacteria bacterium]|nr:MAG: cytochrome C [Actinomycetota bacterium]
MNWVMRCAVSLVVLFIAIQFVPYGRDHSNPPVIAEPVWDSPRTRELAVRACFDCHSNETNWAWYSNVAPVSWLVQDHVDEGRDELNFSEWHLGQEGDEAAETVRDGSMPTRDYLWIHPDARLSDKELEALNAGFIATLGDGDDDGDDDD